MFIVFSSCVQETETGYQRIEIVLEAVREEIFVFEIYSSLFLFFFSTESGHHECYPGEWACPGSGHCIPIGKVCDGTADCPEGEDETNITAGRHCSMY